MQRLDRNYGIAMLQNNQHMVINGVPLWIAPKKERAPSGGAGAERRHTFVLQLRITTPHYGHLILQISVYALSTCKGPFKAAF